MIASWHFRRAEKCTSAKIVMHSIHLASHQPDLVEHMSLKSWIHHLDSVYEFRHVALHCSF